MYPRIVLSPLYIKHTNRTMLSSLCALQHILSLAASALPDSRSPCQLIRYLLSCLWPDHCTMCWFSECSPCSISRYQPPKLLFCVPWARLLSLSSVASYVVLSVVQVHHSCTKPLLLVSKPLVFFCVNTVRHPTPPIGRLVKHLCMWQHSTDWHNCAPNCFKAAAIRMLELPPFNACVQPQLRRRKQPRPHDHNQDTVFQQRLHLPSHPAPPFTHLHVLIPPRAWVPGLVLVL